MLNWNAKLFSKINALSGKNPWLDAFGRAGAEWSIFGILGWFFVMSYFVSSGWGDVWRAFGILAVCGLIGWALDFGIGWIIHEPRPFLTDHNDRAMFHPLIPAIHKWKSFPSDHSMFGFTIFFLALALHLPLSWPLLILALWIGWGRVYAGVHYPADIAGGAAVAAFVAAIANYFLNVV